MTKYSSGSSSTLQMGWTWVALNTNSILFTRFPANHFSVWVYKAQWWQRGGKKVIFISTWASRYRIFFYTPAKSFVILSLRLTQLHTFNIPLQNMAGRLMSCSDCSKSVNKIYMCLGQRESAEADRETPWKPPAAHASKQMVGKS